MSAPTSQRVRRPRVDQDRASDLLSVALDILREVGYEALTMDAVAARGRCSKATLYRLWGGKPQMVASALRAARPVETSDVDTGTLRGDLVALARLASGQVARDTPLIAALAHAALHDAELARALQETLLKPEELNLFVERAVRRGDLPASPPALKFLPQMFFAACFTRDLFENVSADAEYIIDYIDAVILPALTHRAQT
ncbi:TetR/AcrR family transcriptional regulator [Actinocorallia sp. A-T 12471]|uniref:TetR/AcrR family transcriptional regulator n=1 Tax=Actinocorallia sp. A-T 12471 TaxID=3089813 RepID=UPI0029CC6156|nr:TetR/AcrR family transcriptional regulator [Actinocorallia sp. A-T 12471]MDX6739870.1 TetR/AcrR family transcriptional regulator [Actinocorallia sp. A-T 12471]